MIKIIGGTFRRRNIDTPPSETTLPTKNMVRGAMMSSLGERLESATVLDLFAGSGALGIESLSRGAKEAVFVEKDRAAYRVVSINLAKLGLARMRAINKDYLSALAELKGMRFDIVFLDPPYAMKDSYQAAISFLLENDMLAMDASIVCEYEGEVSIDLTPFLFTREYRYGKTKVLLLRRTA